MDNDLRDLVQGWLQKAEHDLKNAKIILEAPDTDKPYDTVCFHCQQAVEKCLKGYLTFLNCNFPKTHSISNLLYIASEKNPDIHQFDNAEILTYYAIENRYPDNYYMPTEQETVEAYKIALSLQKFVFDNIADDRNQNG